MNERDAQVGTNGGLSQRWREEANNSAFDDWRSVANCAHDLDAAKLRIEEAVKDLYGLFTHNGPHVSREAVLKIIREIL